MRRSIVLLVCLLVVLAWTTNAYSSSCISDCRRERLPRSACVQKCAKSNNNNDRGGKKKSSTKSIKRSAVAKSLADQGGADAPLTSAMIWQSYVAELFGFFKRGAPSTGLQILRKPIEATWNTDKSALAEFANKIVNWGVDYKTKSDKEDAPTIASEYGKFLHNINTKPSSKSSADLKSIENNIAEQKKQIAELKQRHDDYKKRCDARPGSFACDGLARITDSLVIAEENLKRYLIEQVPFGDVKMAIDEFEQANKNGTFFWRESFVQKLSTFVARIAAKRLDPFRILVTRGSLQNKQETQDWSWESIKRTSTGSEAIATTNENGKIEYHEHKFSTNSDYFKMEIVAQGSVAIDVAPEQWYDANIIQKYAKGPWVDAAKANYFVKGSGSLSLLLKRVYILYKPTVTLFLSKADATFLKNLCNKSKTISVGPFTADSQAVNIEDTPTEGSKLLYKVSMEEVSESPLIVATENAVMP